MGCEIVFEDVIFGVKVDCLGLNDVLVFLCKGDMFVVWKFDCLGWFMKYLVEIVIDFGDCGVGFKFLIEGVDIIIIGGMLVFYLFGVFV